MASGSITSWEIDGETVETVSDFIFLGSKITADGDWSSDVCSSDLYAEYIMRNAGLDEAQTGIKIARRNISNQIGRASCRERVWLRV